MERERRGGGGGVERGRHRDSASTEISAQGMGGNQAHCIDHGSSRGLLRLSFDFSSAADTRRRPARTARARARTGRSWTLCSPLPSPSPSVSGSGQRARGTEEGNSAAGSPEMNDSTPRSASALYSSRLRGALTSPLPQIKRNVRTADLQFPAVPAADAAGVEVGAVGGAAAARSPREQLRRTTVNIKAMTNHKRQWYQLHSKALAKSIDRPQDQVRLLRRGTESDGFGIWPKSQTTT